MQHATTLSCDDINTHLEKVEGEKLLKGLQGGPQPRWPFGSSAQGFDGQDTPHQPAATGA